EFLAGLGREILQEVEHQLAEILVRRRCAEEIFQPALRQRRLGGISIDEGHACALGGLACRGSDRGEVGADEGLDLLLADETLGFALATSGLPWWSTTTRMTLAPPRPGKPLFLASASGRSAPSLTISAALLIAATASLPICAVGPDSGSSTPILTSCCVCADAAPLNIATHARVTILNLIAVLRSLSYSYR